MNELTKEDLKLILQWRKEVKYTSKPTDQMIASNDRLGEKIQRMIETYDKKDCEHEFITPLNENFRPIGSTECLICGEKG